MKQPLKSMAKPSLCNICLSPNIYPVLYRCNNAQVVHIFCAPCIIRTFQMALKRDNFCGDMESVSLILHRDFRCPICRCHTTYECPVAMLPDEFYTLYEHCYHPTAQDLVCAACETKSDNLCAATRHILYECAKNVFDCALCNTSVSLDTLKPADILRKHVHENKCTGIQCSYFRKFHTSENPGGTVVHCQFRGTMQEVRDHNHLHSFKDLLKTQLESVVESSNRDEVISVYTLLERFKKGKRWDITIGDDERKAAEDTIKNSDIAKRVECEIENDIETQRVVGAPRREQPHESNDDDEDEDEDESESDTDDDDDEYDDDEREQILELQVVSVDAAH